MVDYLGADLETADPVDAVDLERDASRVVDAAACQLGGMQRSYEPVYPRHLGRRFYVSVGAKFAVASTVAAIWLLFSIWLAIPWLRDTSHLLGLVPAIILVTLLAFIPGALVAFLVASLLLDKQPRLTVHSPRVPVTVLIAARNESGAIGETIQYLAAQDYEGPLRVVLVDNGSSDDTADLARTARKNVRWTSASSQNLNQERVMLSIPDWRRLPRRWSSRSTPTRSSIARPCVSWWPDTARHLATS